jgi:hypothetical protein
LLYDRVRCLDHDRDRCIEWNNRGSSAQTHPVCSCRKEEV